MNKLYLTLLFFFIFSCLYGQSVESIVQAEQKTFAALQHYDAFSVSSNNFDVHFYRCEWNVDPAVRFISGNVTSHFTLTAATNSIIFDLSNALTVDSVFYRGSKANFTQTPDNELQINFPSSLPANTKDSVSIFYKGTPPSTGFGSFNLSTHSGVPVMWTLSEPYGARDWWPCKDVLTDKPDSVDIVITNPAAYISSSNGLPVSENTADGKRTIYWRHRYPIAAYLVAFAVTNYAVDADAVSLSGRTMPVVMYAYPESAEGFQAATATAKFCLQGFSPLIGEYPFIRERYAQTQFGWGGGMEHQTNSFIVSAGAGLVAHELAHQWFGNKVTCGSWQDLWLNEGFATYLEYVYTELTNPAGKVQQLQGWSNNITRIPSGSVFIPDTTNINRLFDGRLTYRKGGYLLHMLRWRLGDSTFFRGLRRYLNDPQLQYRHARSADLQRNLEAESGQNLTEFFEDWLYGEGHPNYQAQWSQRSGSHTVRLQLSQTTSHPSVDFYEMLVPLQFKSTTRDTILTVNHVRNGQIFTLNPGFAADTLIIDPQWWILTRDKTAQKLPAPASGEVIIYPNPVVGQFVVSLPGTGNGNVTVHVLNVLGQRMYFKTVPAATTNLDINAANWPAGIYWLQVNGANNFREVKKVLVVKR